MKKSGKKKAFSLTLESNAADSLEHAADHLVQYKTDSDLKFAILHITQALELFVKAYLAAQHPLLVYVKPEENGNDSHTVTLEVAVKRAINCGVEVLRKDKALVDQVRRIRNQIEHHHFDLDKRQVEDLVMRVLEMLGRFIKRYSKHSLDDIVTTPNYLKIVENLRSYEGRVKEAETKARDSLPYDRKSGCQGEVLLCEECGCETIPVTSGGDAECINCGAKVKVEECSSCGQFFITSESDPDVMCRDCWHHLVSKDD